MYTPSITVTLCYHCFRTTLEDTKNQHSSNSRIISGDKMMLTVAAESESSGSGRQSNMHKAHGKYHSATHFIVPPSKQAWRELNRACHRVWANITVGCGRFVSKMRKIHVIFTMSLFRETTVKFSKQHFYGLDTAVHTNNTQHSIYTILTHLLRVKYIYNIADMPPLSPMSCTCLTM